jgi:two-component system, NarL family, nitrate/nitrite response regulator NarL
MEPLHILLIADDPLARMGLARLLSERPSPVTLEEVDSTFLRDGPLNDDSLPDVVVWDIGWVETELLSAAEELVAPGSAPLVALVRDGEQTAVLWAAGVRVLLRRELNGDRLWAAVQAARQGLVVLDASLSDKVLTAVSAAPTPEELTPRERDVLQHLAEGLTNKAIAQRLAVSEHTIKFHVNALMSKLGAQSRTEAVVLATRQGWIVL